MYTQSISPGDVKTDIIPFADYLEGVQKLEVEDISAAVLYVLSTPPNVVVSILVHPRHLCWAQRMKMRSISLQVHDLMLRPMGEKY